MFIFLAQPQMYNFGGDCIMSVFVQIIELLLNTLILKVQTDLKKQI